ncbi:MAG TPA: hypothetical protein VFH03_19555 [Actinoplanes sp.]|nr:hypothetical protein [Actinoplanes sp.]
MSSLPDAERDACDVQQALAALAALLERLPGAAGLADLSDDVREDTRRVLLRLTEDAEVATGRVVDYLRSLRGAGDGAAAAVSPRLGEFRNWVPPRGYLFGLPGPAHRIGELPQPRRCDPGE